MMSSKQSYWVQRHRNWRAYARRAFLAAVGLSIALWLVHDWWAIDVCATNPRVPDPQHTFHFLSAGRHSSTWCYVSSATAHINEWLFVALAVSIAISVVTAIVMWRFTPSE